MSKTSDLVTMRARFGDGLTVFYTASSPRECWHQMKAEHPGEAPEDWDSVRCVQNEA